MRQRPSTGPAPHSVASALFPLLALVPAAQEAPPARAAAPLRIELETLDGVSRARDAGAAPLERLSSEGAAFARYVPRPAAPPAPPDPAAVAEVSLLGGDRVTGVLRGGEGDALRIALGGVELDVAVDGLVSVVFPGRVPRELTQAPAPQAGVDVLYVVAGASLDRAEGLVEEFRPTGVVFEDSRVGQRTFPWERVAALFVTPLEASAPEGPDAPAREPVVVALAGGGRLSGGLLGMGPSGVELARPGGARLLLPPALVAEVVLADGSFAFLSELPVADPGPVSMFGDELGFTWPHRVDRAVGGGPLTVLGRVESRGLGVHAPSRLTWRLAGEWARLRVGGAVDDSGLDAERGGTVVFRVLGDGRELWKSGPVRAGQGAVEAPALDLGGVQELVLEVDPAGDFVLDRADWLRPVLVRS